MRASARRMGETSQCLRQMPELNLRLIRGSLDRAPCEERPLGSRRAVLMRTWPLRRGASIRSGGPTLVLPYPNTYDIRGGAGHFKPAQTVNRKRCRRYGRSFHPSGDDGQMCAQKFETHVELDESRVRPVTSEIYQETFYLVQVMH
jgi:hypothetical protein